MIDFSAIDSSLHQRARDLLPAWLPGGRFRGHEYFCSGIGGGDGDSMHVTVKSDSIEFFDFANPNCSGVGMTSLYAAIHGLRNGEAAKQLSETYGLDAITDDPPPPRRMNGSHGKPSLPAPAPPATLPPPDPAEPPSTGHSALYRYSATWFIARHDKPDGSKTFRPWRWTGTAWEAKAPEKPRPLYRMADAPPDATLLIVEGEKACHAAAEAIQTHHAITWAGGASAIGTSDWSVIRDRQVTIWPDADEPGRVAAAKIAGLLLKQGCTVRMLDPPADWDAGYDVADAVADGLDIAALIASARPVGSKTPAEKSQTSSTERPAYLQWQDWGLAANERGPYATEANCLIILGNAPNFSGRIWLDEFSQRLMIDDETAKHGCREFSRTDAITALVWMQHELKLPKMGLSAVERAALLIGHRQKRHPVKDWFATLEWDGIERLPKLLADGWGAEQSEYTAAVGTNWMVGMVARVFDPGCKADNCVIFEGAQGTRKSSSLRALIGDRWFYECNIDPVRKPVDFSMSTQGRLFMEIPEVDRYMRGDRIRDMVALVSTQEDTYRAPYAPTVMSYPRQCAVGGSTNKAQLYDDPDGSRRWWPFIVRQVNMEFILQNRELLWAEALAKYKRGETWWQVPEDAARAAQLSRLNRDEWETIIERYVTHEPSRWKDQVGVTWTQRILPLSQVTSADLLEHALGLEPGRWSQPDQRRVSAACQALGWRSVSARVDGRVARVWRVSESEPAPKKLPQSDDDIPY